MSRDFVVTIDIASTRSFSLTKKQKSKETTIKSVPNSKACMGTTLNNTLKSSDDSNFLSSLNFLLLILLDIQSMCYAEFSGGYSIVLYSKI